MKHSLFFLCLLFVWSCNPSQQSNSSSASSEPHASDWLRSVIDSIDVDNHFNGLVLVQRGDSTPIFASKGSQNTRAEGPPFTLDDRFYIASLSKLFTGAATLVLMEEYGLNADDPIGPYFPELKPALGAVTIRQLANHTNGIHDFLSLTEDHQGLGNKDALALLTPLDSTVFPPGSRWGYSNSGYVLLAELIERVSGKSFEAYQDEHLFSKFLPKADRVHPPTETYLTGYLEGKPNSVFLSTTGDAGIVLSAMEWLALYHNDSLFADHWQKAKALSSPWNDPSWQYGFGWFFTTDTLGEYRAHSGRSEGFEGFVRINLDHDLFLLILSNRSGPIVKQLRLGLFEVLAAKPE